MPETLPPLEPATAVKVKQAEMETGPAVREGAVDQQMICGCTGLSLGALRRRIAQNPNLSFEKLSIETGAGTKCTACLLDLEYHFVEAQRTSDPSKISNADDGLTKKAPSFKRRLYGWLDRLSPMVSYPLSNTVPVLFGEGIEQWVWITNRSMLFEGNVCAPLMKIEFIVRDEYGRVVETVRREVPGESGLRHNVSASLLAAAGEVRPGQLYAGSVEIRRAGDQAGIRGTTRPQIEILSAKAACAVHGQAMSGAGQYWFSCLNRPLDERMYFAMLNGADREQTIRISYPVNDARVDPIEHEVTVPAHGAALHQLTLPETVSKVLGERAITLTWRAEALHKLWGVCATPQLDRFSIDHL